MRAEDELFQRRTAKLKDLKAAGIDPYGGRFDRTHTVALLKEDFDRLADAGAAARVSGRLMIIREHGKASFADLRDATGGIQLYIKDKEIGDGQYSIFKLLDMGDFIGVSGIPFRTKTGEMTILVKNLTVLSKALRPLPEKWHGLKDTELRYRKRYLDILSNKKTQDVFEKRLQIVSSIRKFLESEGYREVETPMLQVQAGGAAGRPFMTRSDALGTDLYLRIAPELYLKRLLVGGWEKIFELNRSFRNEGLSPRHNPEFTMLEVYTAFADYTDMMNLTEQLFVHVADMIFGKPSIIYNGRIIDVSPPWERITFNEAMKRRFNVDTLKEGMEALKEKLAVSGVKLEKKKNISRMQLIKLLSEFLTSEKPTFITDYPAEFCPLAKRNRDNPALTERFELFMCGTEIANAYSELNDPLEQKERFAMQVEDEEKHKIDTDFIEALEYGMPPAAGLGIGVDRMVMIMTDSHAIRDVLLFPQLALKEGGREKK